MDRTPIVFPIRFATRNLAVQTTTRDLSRDGVFVRCLEPPAAGTEVKLKLYLPGTRAGMETSAVVREVAPAELPDLVPVEVLLEGSTHRDVDYLLAAADPHHRQVLFARLAE